MCIVKPHSTCINWQLQQLKNILHFFKSNSALVSTINIQVSCKYHYEQFTCVCMHRMCVVTYLQLLSHHWTNLTHKKVVGRVIPHLFQKEMSTGRITSNVLEIVDLLMAPEISKDKVNELHPSLNVTPCSLTYTQVLCAINFYGPVLSSSISVCVCVRVCVGGVDSGQYDMKQKRITI